MDPNDSDTISTSIIGLDKTFMVFDAAKKEISFDQTKISDAMSGKTYTLSVKLTDQLGASSSY